MILTEENKKALAEKVRTKSVFQASLTPAFTRYLDLVELECTSIETTEGLTRVDIIRAKDRIENCPLYINIHGGGFVREHEQRETIYSAKVAVELKGITLDIFYHLAPENPFPFAFNECYSIVSWAFENATTLGVDARKIFVGGNSAGGNLTMAIMLKANETKDFRIALGEMVYPAIDNKTDPADIPEIEKSALPLERMRTFLALYTNQDWEVGNNPFCSPKYAKDEMLKGLPEMIFITAGKDCLRFQAEDFAVRLATLGNTVTLRRFMESNHGFLTYCKDEWEEGQRFLITCMKTKVAEIDGSFALLG